MGPEKFKRDVFVGLNESIEALSEREVTVHLSVIETKKGPISLWLADNSNTPVGIVIARSILKNDDELQSLE